MQEYTVITTGYYHAKVYDGENIISKILMARKEPDSNDSKIVNDGNSGMFGAYAIPLPGLRF